MCYHFSIGQQYRKESLNQSTNSIQKRKLRLREDIQILLSKVGRAITKREAIQKSPILLVQYWKNELNWYQYLN